MKKASLDVSTTKYVGILRNEKKGGNINEDSPAKIKLVSFSGNKIDDIVSDDPVIGHSQTQNYLDSSITNL